MGSGLVGPNAANLTQIPVLSIPCEFRVGEEEKLADTYVYYFCDASPDRDSFFDIPVDLL
jgi:hypothetical protein